MAYPVSIPTNTGTADMNFYLTQSTGYGWNAIESGPHASKEAVKQAAMSMIEAASSAEDLAILESLHVMASMNRVGEGKSLRNDWIAGHNELSRSEDLDIDVAFCNAQLRCGQNCQTEDEDPDWMAELDAELAAGGF